MAGTFDYEKDIPTHVRASLEAVLRRDINNWYVGLKPSPSAALRSMYGRSKNINAILPTILTHILEILAEEADKEETASSSGASKIPMTSPGSGKPEPAEDKELAKLLAEIAGLSKAPGSSKGSSPAGGFEEDIEEKEYDISAAGAKGGDGVRHTRKMGKAVSPPTAVIEEPKSSISKMETTSNRICACPKCMKGA